jgi:hypothetical protein
MVKHIQRTSDPISLVGLAVRTGVTLFQQFARIVN